VQPAPAPSDKKSTPASADGSMSTGTKVLLAVLGIVLIGLLVLLARYLAKKRGGETASSLAYTEAAIN